MAERDQSHQPTHHAYSVIKREGQDDYWLKLGSVFPHKDGKGFNIMLQAIPFDPKIVCRKITGDNPAIVQVGATYTDLGVTITGPQYDLNLGIQTFLNGAAMSPVQIDTTQVATDNHFLRRHRSGW